MVSLTQRKYLVAHRLPTHCCILILLFWFSLQTNLTISHGFTQRIRKSSAHDFYALKRPFSLMCIFVPINLLNHSILLIERKIYHYQEIRSSMPFDLFIKAWYYLDRPWTLSIQFLNPWIDFRRFLLSSNKKLLLLLHSLHNCYPFQTNGCLLCFGIFCRTYWILMERLQREQHQNTHWNL